MLRQDLERMTREQLIAEAERLGIPRPRVLTQPELIDEIIGRTTKSERERVKARGWLGRARDLLARVVDRGLHLPEAARVLRKDGDDRSWPAPPPPLPTVTLAEIYAAQGHLERAIAVLDEVLAREPDHREAKAMRERFLEQAHRSRARIGRELKEEPAPAPKEVAKEKKPPKQAPPPQIEEAKHEPAPVTVPAQVAPTVTLVKEIAEAVAAAVPAVIEKVEEAFDDGAASGPKPRPPSEAVAAVPAVIEEAIEEAAEVVAAAQPVIDETVEALASTERAPTVPPPAAVEPLEEPPLPERYEVDEVVAIAVDPRTIYLYWEVRPTTLAHARAQQPDGWLCVRVASVIATWEGPLHDSRDLHVDALYGDRFIRDIQPGSNVRVSVGWRSSAGYEPFAVGSEVVAPRMSPVETIAQEVARWEADPVVAPFQARGPEAAAAPLPHAPVHAPVGAPPSVFAERMRTASRGHAAPVDTGVASWGAGPIDETARYEEHVVEEVVDAPWFETIGSSELYRGKSVRTTVVRRLLPGAPPFGGASELSP